MVYTSKFEADEVVAVASVTPIDRAKNMRAGEVIGLEYLEHERRRWLWRLGGAMRVGGGGARGEMCRNDGSYGGSGGAGAVGDGPTDLSDDVCTGLGGC